MSRRSISLIAVGASIPLVLFLTWIMYFKTHPGVTQEWVRLTPILNVFLNLIAAACLVAGFLFIRRGNRPAHRNLMITAFLVSVVFLISYVAYHYAVGHTTFRGIGIWRPVYFTVLVSHIATAVTEVPLFLITLYLALAGRFDEHKKIARFTFPVCLYVSVTGIIVFVFLYGWR